MQSFLENARALNDFHWQGSPYQYILYVGIALVLLLSRRKTIRLVLGWFPLVYLACIYNPVFVKVLELAGLGGGAYFVRMFSFMPIMYAVAAGTSFLISKARGAIKFLAVCCVCALLVATGRSIYAQDWFIRADNLEKVSRDTLEVAAAIESENGEDIGIGTFEPVTNYMRQVADVVTVYARIPGRLWYLLNNDPPDVQAVMKEAGAQGLDYVTARRTEATLSAFAAQGYEPCATTDSLAIFRVSGVDQIRNVLNEKRQVVAVTAYDAQGNKKQNRQGYTTIRYGYDDRGYCNLESYLDENEQPIMISAGYAAISREYSVRGLLKSVRYLDLEGRPVLVTGRFETRYDYDIYGRLTFERYYGQDGKPMDRTDTHYASREICYNRQGLQSSEKYRNAQGESVLCSEGYAEYRRTYDEGGNLTGEFYYGTDGSLVILGAGNAGYKSEYDERGNVIREIYLDASGNPATQSTGYAECRKEYNELNQLVKETYWDEKGNPAAVAKGYCGVIREYSEAGDIAREIYLNEHGEEGARGEGYSRIEWQYDDRGQVSRVGYYLGQMPFTLPDGYAAYIREYDDKGNNILEGYLDAEGYPVRRASGFAFQRRSYDELNRLIREEYLDEYGEPVYTGSGYAALTREYDQQGNLIREAYFDAQGNPVLRSDGYASMEREWNEQKQLVRETYYGLQGEPVNNSDGTHGFERIYEGSTLIEEITLDAAVQ